MKPLPFVARFSAGVLVTLLLSSCGSFFPGNNTIIAITVSPQSFYVLTSGTAPFKAQGTFGNNSTGDVTSQVSWASSNTSIATINTSGTATATSSLPSGTKLASTTITAKSGSVVSNNATLIVATVHIQNGGIAVSPGSQTVTTGAQFQFTATATLADGTLGIDITRLASWTSSNTAVATVNSSGLATAVSAGTATIQASLDSQSSSGTLTVQ